METATYHIPLDARANIERYASSKGVTPEDAITEWAMKLIPAVPLLEPRNEWERKLLSATSSAGVSLSDESVSSEGIYE